jgi:hypothetical protein
VLEFSRWMESAVAARRPNRLLNYRELAPHAAARAPDEDHFLPLFFALGAAGDEVHANYMSREVMYSMLAMDAFALSARKAFHEPKFMNQNGRSQALGHMLAITIFQRPRPR